MKLIEYLHQSLALKVKAQQFQYFPFQVLYAMAFY